MSARDQNPLGGLLQQLCSKLPPDRVEQVVGGQHNRVLFGLDRQNVVLEDEPARQNRPSMAIDLLEIESDPRDPEEIPNRVQDPVFINFPGIQNWAAPGTAVEILGKLDRFLGRLDAAGEKKIDD